MSMVAVCLPSQPHRMRCTTVSLTLRPICSYFIRTLKRSGQLAKQISTNGSNKSTITTIKQLGCGKQQRRQAKETKCLTPSNTGFDLTPIYLITIKLSIFLKDLIEMTNLFIIFESDSSNGLLSSQEQMTVFWSYRQSKSCILLRSHKTSLSTQLLFLATLAVSPST